MSTPRVSVVIPVFNAGDYLADALRSVARQTYRDLEVVLVDDGLSTGASMFAAIEAIRDRDAEKIIVAVPAAPESTIRELRAMVDEVVCATMPRPFSAVSASFWNFQQVTDDDVLELLAKPTSAVHPSGTVISSRHQKRFASGPVEAANVSDPMAPAMWTAMSPLLKKTSGTTSPGRVGSMSALRMPNRVHETGSQAAKSGTNHA